MIYIGTSGWHYKHWIGNFYPNNIRKKEFLKYYGNHFQIAEINNSFYRLPNKETLEKWRDTVSEKFIFTVKGSRYITHMKKLHDPREAVENFIKRIKILNSKLGPILFQLPPRWNCNKSRLNSFLSLLPDQYKYSFEFRNESWFNDNIYEILEKYNVSFCIYDYDGKLSPEKVTADFIYIRFHGPEGPYKGHYDDNFLFKWAGKFKKWQKHDKEIFCFFDNDQYGYAPDNALKLKKIITGKE